MPAQALDVAALWQQNKQPSAAKARRDTVVVPEIGIKFLLAYLKGARDYLQGASGNYVDAFAASHPAALPTLFAGLRLAVGRAMVVAITVEMVSSTQGLGG